jgi:hypothetical protein
MSRREEILQDDVYLVGGKLKNNVDAPNGIVYPEEVDALRDEFFTFSIGHLSDEMVTVKKEYPKKDTVDVIFESDFIVMRRKDFDELIHLDNE